MRLPGRPDEKFEMVKTLSHQSFPYLIADILIVKHSHTEVKILDGPGDGRRDILSKDKWGNPCLTQCKFSDNVSKSASSRETDEIVIACVKFGIKHAIFCTTSKISPQSKREYEDNYPGYSFDWIDGAEIASCVMESALLRKIWCDGESIRQIATRIAIPLLVRNMVTGCNLDPEELKISLVSNERFSVEVTTGFYPPVQFNPYQEVENIQSFGFSSNLWVKKIILQGEIDLMTLQDYYDIILTAIQHDLDYTASLKYAIRFGIPHFQDEDVLSHEQTSSYKFNLPIPPETFVVSQVEILDEFSWLTFAGQNWLPPSYIKMSQISDYRLYKRKDDLCLGVFYRFIPTDVRSNRALLYNELRKVLWQNSFFVQGLTENIERLIQSLHDDELPSKVHKYGPSHSVAYWIHPAPLIFSIDVDRFRNELINEEFEALKKSLLSLITSFKLKPIDWILASKVAALNDDEPFSQNQETVFGLVQIQEEFEKIPSPFNPHKRQYVVEKIWRVCPNNKSSEQLLEDFLSSSDVFFYNNGIEVLTDDQTVDYVYLRLSHKVDFNYAESIEEIISAAYKQINIIFDLANEEIKAKFPEGFSCTKEYYWKELGIELHREKSQHS